MFNGLLFFPHEIKTRAPRLAVINEGNYGRTSNSQKAEESGEGDSISRPLSTREDVSISRSPMDCHRPAGARKPGSLGIKPTVGAELDMGTQSGAAARPLEYEPKKKSKDMFYDRGEGASENLPLGSTLWRRRSYT